MLGDNPDMVNMYGEGEFYSQYLFPDNSYPIFSGCSSMREIKK